MPTDNKNHRRTQCHILFMAILIAVFAVASIVSSCRNDGELSASEQKELLYYNDAINNAQDSGLYEKMAGLIKEFYEVSKKGHSDIFRAYAGAMYGQGMMAFGNPDEGKKIFEEMLEIASKYDDDTIMMEIYNGLGMYEQMKDGNHYAASEYFLKSLEYARHGDKRNLILVLYNLCTSFTAVNDTTGQKYMEEAYEIAKETGSRSDMMTAAQGMAQQMHIRNQKEETLKWRQIYMENLPQAQRMTMGNYLKAQNSFLLEDYAEANRYIDIAVSAADTTKNIELADKANIYSLKAAILYDLGKYQESIKWLDKESELFSEHNSKEPRRTLRYYAMNYEKLGDYDKALEYRKKQIEVIETNANTDRINILKAKEVALDVAKKDAEIEYHRDHADLMEWLLWGAVAFIALLTALCLYIYNMYKRQRKLMTVVVERAQPEEIIEEQREKQTDNKHVELFRQIKEEIDDKKMFLDVNLSRESLAKHLGTNRTYISEAVAQMTGMNFPQYINLLRINEAERRLHDPQVDVSNFANFGRTLGFASLNAFRTAFKQQTGMTLSAYREIARKRPTPALPV